MSTSPKYQPVALQREVQQRLERERQRKAAEEARRRHEAEEKERQRRLESLRARQAQELTYFISSVASSRHDIYDADFTRIQDAGREHMERLRKMANESDLKNISGVLQTLQDDLINAIQRKRRDDAERQRLALLDRLKLTLRNIEQILGQVPENDRVKHDAEGSRSAIAAVKSAYASIDKGETGQASREVERAKSVCNEHLSLVRSRHTQWSREKFFAEKSVEELTILAIGIREDLTVATWFANAASDIDKLVDRAANALAREQFDRPSIYLAEAKSLTDQFIKQANDAQLKLERCKYIASGISATLCEMGFTVGPVREEHPGNPASALLLSAATAAGKSVHVSVPVEGEVWYVVDGYPHLLETNSTGDPVATCDEAESVLNEMATRLTATYGVDTGELNWQGKDPNRKLRAQKALPESRSGSREGGSY